MQKPHAGKYVQCLDVIKIASPPGPQPDLHDCAIMLEIWDLGALLQTSIPIPHGTVISLAFAQGVPAKVISCEQDDYGFLVKIAILEGGWFPDVYMPPYVMHA